MSHQKVMGGGNPVTLAVVGAGGRGLGYARRAVANGARITAVAEVQEPAREAFAREFDMEAEQVFEDWSALLDAGRLADAIVIATPDVLHVEPAVRAAEIGYDILLEKPMAPSEADSLRIVEAAEKAGVLLAVCHVMRYAPNSTMLKDLLAAGRIGDIVSIEHLEPVGWWHQAHSFVRGNWRREDESGPMLLTKSCHDIDFLTYLMEAVPAKVSSFGSLTHFRAENRPAGAASRCVECPVEAECAYSAKKIYLPCIGDPVREYWPLSVVSREPTEEAVLEALAEGPYGRCVYDCDNDVVDHQVVNMEFPSGATASFTMTAFTELDHRKTRIFGTRGCIENDGVTLRVHDFVTDEIEVITTEDAVGVSAADGHGGGDEALVQAFLSAVADRDPDLLLSDARTSLAGHRVVWAAERARRDSVVVQLDELLGS